MLNYAQFFVRRKIYAVACIAVLSFVSWGLLSTDPLAVVKRSPFSFLTVISDLMMHCSAYCVLASVCLIPAAIRADVRLAGVVVSFLAAHGVVTELMQHFIPNRTCDALDAMANLAGISLGALFVGCFVRPRLDRQAVHRR